MNLLLSLYFTSFIPNTIKNNFLSHFFPSFRFLSSLFFLPFFFRSYQTYKWKLCQTNSNSNSYFEKVQLLRRTKGKVVSQSQRKLVKYETNKDNDVITYINILPIHKKKRKGKTLSKRRVCFSSLPSSHTFSTLLRCPAEEREKLTSVSSLSRNQILLFFSLYSKNPFFFFSYSDSAFYISLCSLFFCFWSDGGDWISREKIEACSRVIRRCWA